MADWHHRFILFFVMTILTGCAALNPNPNIGLRSVDLMLEHGNCSGAMELLQGHAKWGEPWAQLRLGVLSLNKQCPGVERDKGIEWLARAACYESKTAWEKGNELVIGQTGYFNATFSSKNAAFKLAQINNETGNLQRVRYWLTIGANKFESGTPDRAFFEEWDAKVKPLMTPAEIAEADGLTICDKVRAMPL